MNIIIIGSSNICWNIDYRLYDNMISSAVLLAINSMYMYAAEAGVIFLVFLFSLVYSRVLSINPSTKTSKKEKTEQLCM